MFTQGALAGGEKLPGAHVERGPRAVAQMVVAQRGGPRPNAPLFGIKARPALSVGEQRALGVVKEATPVGTRHQKRQVDHAAVDRHRTIGVARVAQLRELGRDPFEIVAHQRPDVAQQEPAIAGELVLRVVHRHMLAVIEARVSGGDHVHIRHVQRAEVGEIQMHLGVVAGSAFEREHVVEVRHRLLTLSRFHLAPPHVGVVVIGGAGSRVPVEEDTQVRLERVGGVGRIPDGNKVRCGGHCDYELNYGVEITTRMMRSSLGNSRSMYALPPRSSGPCLPCRTPLPESSP